MNQLSVSEYFYSLQGEGRTVGIPAVFVRLSGCNLMCGGWGVERDGLLREGATWVCDTIAVWLRGTLRPTAEWLHTWNQELSFIEKLRSGVHLVITGGEPLLHAERIVFLLQHIESEYNLRPIVEIETNGTLLPPPELLERVRHWNCSPKLSNSGMPFERRLRPNVLRLLADQGEQTMFKFVVTHPEDWHEIERDFLQPGYIRRHQIVLMPGADSRERLWQLGALTAQLCMEHNLRMGTRLHVEIWDKLTGV